MSFTNQLLATAIVLLVAAGLVREFEHQYRRRHRVPKIVVEVSGHVVQPKILTLPADARVVHAVALCGGLKNGANTTELSLAAPLADGQKLLIPARPTGPALGTSLASKQKFKLDLNRATKAQLINVPGIGPVTAGRILEARDQRGGSFTSLEDLAAIRGIKGKTLSRLRAHIKIEGI